MPTRAQCYILFKIPEEFVYNVVFKDGGWNQADLTPFYQNRASWFLGEFYFAKPSIFCVCVCVWFWEIEFIPSRKADIFWKDLLNFEIPFLKWLVSQGLKINKPES